MESLFSRQSYPEAKTLTKEDAKVFFRNVYSYMFLALIVSGLVSWYLASSNLFMEWFINPTTGAPNFVYFVVLFAPIGLVFLIQAKLMQFSLNSLIALYVLYAALIGASLASIFFTFSLSNIALAFFVSAGAFAGMAILGYTTSTDLSKFGSLLYMALIGIIIALVVNLFLKSSAFDYLISVIGVFVFTGLTAWEMQRLKSIAVDPQLSGELKQKASLIGGLTLYILFVNLFLMVLSLFKRN